MTRTSILTALLLILCAATLNAQTQTPGGKEKEEAIRRLLEVSKAGDVGQQIVSEAIIKLKENLQSVPAEKRERILQIFEEEMRKDFSTEKIIEGVIPIYDKYLSLEEVRQLTAIYETPIGQKLMSVLPQITREAMQSGEKMAVNTTQRVEARLWAEGLLESPKPQQPDVIKQPAVPRRGRRSRP